MSFIRFLLRFGGVSVVTIAMLSAATGASGAALVSLMDGGGPLAGRVRLQLWSYVALIAALIASGVAARLLSARVARRLGFTLRMRLARQMLALPLRRIEQVGSARLVASLIEDTPTMTRAVSTLPQLCTDAALVIGCFVHLAWLSPVVFLLMTAVGAASMVTSLIPRRRLREAVRLEREDSARLVKLLGALAGGIKELQLHRPRREMFAADELEDTGRSFVRHGVRSAAIEAGLVAWHQLLYAAAVAVLLFGGAATSWSTQPASAYAVPAFLAGIALMDLLAAWTALTRASVAFARIGELGFDPTADGEREGTPPRVLQWQEIELCGVTHRYRDAAGEGGFEIGPIDLRIRRGELVFVIGGNGSGKTTLSRLLIGLYEPESGELRLDGTPVDAARRESYRQLFSVVFSDCFVFDRLLGLEAAAVDRRAPELLSALRLTGTVSVHDGRFSRTDVSQGQRKRLALLTACLEDRPIYVFDEWAADQDPVFKEYFYRVFLPALRAQGKTLIAITHDDRYYDAGDRIVKLESGRIEHDGRRETSSLAGFTHVGGEAVAAGAVLNGAVGR